MFDTNPIEGGQDPPIRPSQESNGMQKDSEWSNWLTSLTMFSDDFMTCGRDQPDPQEREDL